MESSLAAFAVQRPVHFNATAQSLHDDEQALIQGTRAAWDGVLASVRTPADATFQNTIAPIIRDENTRSETQRVLRFYATTSPSAALRNASNAATSQLFEHLFGVRLVTVDVNAASDMAQHLVWHNSVQMFSAWNVDDAQSPQFLGYAYLDLFIRDQKWTHAGHYSLQQGYDKADGSRFHPSSVLVMNYIQPSPQTPTFLRLDDVRKLFPELGHLFHGLFSHSRYAGLHRVNKDFVETPSLMLEQFFWQARHIRDVSWHYSYAGPVMETPWQSSSLGSSEGVKLRPTPQLSNEQAAGLAQTNYAKIVRDQLKELFFSTYDQLVHSPATHEYLEATNLTELFNRTRADVYQLHGGEALDEGWEWGHVESVFRNVINGYDGEYYSYILGSVFALDIFDVGFKDESMSKEAGRRYRDMVLAKGGSQPEIKTLVDYLGHEPSIKPYFAWFDMP